MRLQPTNELIELKLRLRSFVQERDWEKFHNPKNLVMALSGEVGELSEAFQWLSTDECSKLSKQQLSDVSNEIADVFLYLLRLSDVLGIDLLSAAQEKIKINETRYPVELSKGNSKKYTQF